jgi:hypothetical protein
MVRGVQAFLKAAATAAVVSATMAVAFARG